MGKSIRSKRQRHFRSIKREKNAPKEELMLKKILKLVPDDEPKRFSFTAPKDENWEETSKDLGLMMLNQAKRKQETVQKRLEEEKAKKEEEEEDEKDAEMEMEKEMNKDDGEKKKKKKTKKQRIQGGQQNEEINGDESMIVEQQEDKEDRKVQKLLGLEEKLPGKKRKNPGQKFKLKKSGKRRRRPNEQNF